MPQPSPTPSHPYHVLPASDQPARLSSSAACFLVPGQVFGRVESLRVSRGEGGRADDVGSVLVRYHSGSEARRAVAGLNSRVVQGQRVQVRSSPSITHHTHTLSLCLTFPTPPPSASQTADLTVTNPSPCDP